MEGDRGRLALELEKMLKKEKEHPTAAGYFLINVEENDLRNRKYKVIISLVLKSEIIWNNEWPIFADLNLNPGLNNSMDCNLHARQKF